MTEYLDNLHLGSTWYIQSFRKSSQQFLIIRKKHRQCLNEQYQYFSWCRYRVMKSGSNSSIFIHLSRFSWCQIDFTYWIERHSFSTLSLVTLVHPMVLAPFYLPFDWHNHVSLTFFFRYILYFYVTQLNLHINPRKRLRIWILDMDMMITIIIGHFYAQNWWDSFFYICNL